MAEQAAQDAAAEHASMDPAVQIANINRLLRMIRCSTSTMVEGNVDDIAKAVTALEDIIEEMRQAIAARDATIVDLRAKLQKWENRGR